jgi:hypothetical protein
MSHLLRKRESSTWLVTREDEGVRERENEGGRGGKKKKKRRERE